MPLIEVDADEFAQLNADYKAVLLKLDRYEKMLDKIFAIAALTETDHITTEDAHFLLVNQFPDAFGGWVSYDIPSGVRDPLPMDDWRKS